MKALKVVVASIGVIASVVSIWAFMDRPYSAHPVNDVLLGEWSSEYDYPTSTGRNEVTSVSTFFENGNYNVKGNHRIVVFKDGTELVASYELSGAGTWSSKRDRLYMTLESLKTSLAGVTIDGKGISTENMPKDMVDSFPKIENHLADGTTQEYQIVSSGREQVVLITSDPAGAEFQLAMQRRNAR